MHPGTSRRLALLTMFALLLALPLPSAAQSRYVRLEGRVQWIAGTVLSLAGTDGWAVGIDLRRAPQSDYSGVGQGDWVVVLAELSDDYRRVFAVSIRRGYPGIQAP
jgi:hypothetical protein